LLAQFFRDGLLMLPSLGGRGGQRLPKPLHFFFNRVIFDGPVRNPEQLGVQHQGLSDGHARRNRNAAFDFHASQKFAATDETRMVHGEESVLNPCFICCLLSRMSDFKSSVKSSAEWAVRIV